MLKEQTQERLRKLEGLEGVRAIDPNSLGMQDIPRELLGSLADAMIETDMDQAAALNRQVIARLGLDLDSGLGLINDALGENRAYLTSFTQAGYVFVRTGDDDEPAGMRRIFLSTGSDSAGAYARMMIETDVLILGYEKSAPTDLRRRLINTHDLTPLSAIDPLMVERYRVAGSSLELALELMDTETDLRFAEPELVEIYGFSTAPTSAQLHTSQWQHANIRTPSAWKSTTGVGVRAAIIDVQFYAGHAALNNLNHNLSATFVGNDLGETFTTGAAGFPDGSHGTRCGGMLAGSIDTATFSGSTGLTAGVAYDANLRFVAIDHASVELDTTDLTFTQWLLAEALTFAVQPSWRLPTSADPGADIISCSLNDWESGHVSLTGTLAAAIDFAKGGRGGLGTLIFWSTPNVPFPTERDEIVSHPYVMGVGGSTPADMHMGTSYGSAVEFVAPGDGLLLPNSTVDGYNPPVSGNSFAAPCAAGVAALMLEINPALTMRAVRTRLRWSCKNLGGFTWGSLPDPRFGYGRINAQRAVLCAKISKLTGWWRYFYQPKFENPYFNSG